MTEIRNGDVLYGRESLLERVRKEVGLVLVEGDSGIGKSAIISALAVGWGSYDAVPGARLLGSSRGAVEGAFIDELAELLYDHAERSPHLASEAWRIVNAVVDTATNATAVGVGKALVEGLYSAIGRRFGAEAEAASREVGKAASLTVETLEAELSAVAREDVATELIALAGKVAASIGRRVILRFDQGEVLHDDDLRLLGDLAQREIPELMIVIGFSTADPIDSEHKLTALEVRGAKRFRVPPLDDEGLSQWLRDERVPSGQWADVRRVTSGYPLFVRDAIDLLAAGASLDGLGTPAGFTNLMRKSWLGLPLELRRRAMELIGLVDAPDDEYVLALLDVDQLLWSAMREELVARNIFVIRADTTSWFHDRRRAYLWGELATDNDRLAIGRRSLQVLKQWQASRQFIDAWVVESLPGLIDVGLTDEAEDAYLLKVRGLETAELAIALALIELVEPNSSLGQFAATSSVITYAVERLGRVFAASEALEGLVEAGLVHIASNDQASIVCLIFEGPLAYPALIARIRSNLELTVRPRFASSIFGSLLAPRMGDFISASTSVGYGTIRHHQRTFDEIRLAEIKSSRHLRPLFGLGAVAKIDGQHVSSTVLFETKDQRELAFRACEAYSNGEGLGLPEFGQVPGGGVARCPSV